MLSRGDADLDISGTFGPTGGEACINRGNVEVDAGEAIESNTIDRQDTLPVAGAASLPHEPAERKRGGQPPRFFISPRAAVATPASAGPANV